MKSIIHAGSIDRSVNGSLLVALFMRKVPPQPGDISLRRSSELLLVVAAKVRGVFVSDTETGTRCIQVFAKHQTPGFLQVTNAPSSVVAIAPSSSDRQVGPFR